jgi:hypothetical protein
MRARLKRVVGAQNEKNISMDSVEREREREREFQIRERKGQKVFEIAQSK